MYLNSHKYPAIKYEKGEEIFLSPEETNWSFYFDVEEELTSDDKAMGIVASMIDEIDILLKTAKDCLKKILADKKNKYYETVLYFMEFHREVVILYKSPIEFSLKNFALRKVYSFSR